MDISLKRIGAYLIDIALITIIVTLLGHIKFINPSYALYQENYVKYNELINNYKDNKIKKDDYEKELITLNYKLGQENVVNGVITIVTIIIYFGVIEYFWDGETVGRKLTKIKLVSNKDKQKLHLGNYLIRTFILNNILFRILLIIGVYVFKEEPYFNFASIISFIESVVESVILIMVVLRKDNRGLHDMVAQTKVIDVAKNTK